MAAILGLLLRLLGLISPQSIEPGDDMDSLPEHPSEVESPGMNDLLGLHDVDASNPERSGVGDRPDLTGSLAALRAQAGKIEAGE